jgi:hypothetical protein
MDAARQLVERYLDQLASPEEFEELLRLLPTRPDLADALAAATRAEVLLENQLRESRTASTVTNALPAAPRATLASMGRAASVPPLPPPRRRAWKWCAAALLLLAVGAALGYHLGRREHSGAVVSGRVLVNGVETARVPHGSHLEVMGEHSAVIRLPGGAHAELAPASSATLRGRAAGAPSVVELARGRATFRLEGTGRAVRVETPVGSVSAHDAAFTVALQLIEVEEGAEPMIRRAALALVVTALLGHVEVSHKGRHVVVSAGEKRTFLGPAKVPYKKPSLAGTVVAISDGGKTLTVQSPPAKKGQPPRRTTVRLTAETHLDYFGVPAKAHKPTVGYLARVWLKEDSTDVAARVSMGLKPIVLSGTIAAVSDDGKEITLNRGPVSKRKKGSFTVKLGAHTKRVYKGVKKGAQPAVGSFAQVWLKVGSKDVASAIVFFAKRPPKLKKGKKPAKGADGPKKPVGRVKKPAKKGSKPSEGKNRPKKPVKPIGKVKKPGKKSSKPSEGKKGKKFEAPALPPKPARPARDPAPLAAIVDAEVTRALVSRKVPASPPADDGEFLRRVSLDLTGRIPTYRRTVAFLESKDPAKRRVLIDELLERTEYGEHLGTLWANLLAPPQDGKAGKARGPFTPWLEEQLNRNRGWNSIVTDLLTVEGPLKGNPQSAFLMANSEGFRPQPNRIAGAVARAFWGIQLRCAECHDHPFARWKQTDFWGTAAFFGRLRFTGFKGRGIPPSLTEEVDKAQPPKRKKAKGKKAQIDTLRGNAIVIPMSAGRAAGRAVPARFLGGDAPDLSGVKAWRPRFAAWATGANHPYFARATANRLWAHLFGRGLVHPIDKLDSETPSHPALLDRLARELSRTNFDLKHLLRVLCNTRTYQRTSRTVAGNAKDSTLFSHAALKTMTPEMLLDSVQVVFAVDKTDPDMRPFRGGKKVRIAREEFIRFFRPRGEGNEPTVYTHGIPHLLHLLNAPLLNRSAPLVHKLCATDASRAEAITALYLAALSRRPRPAEVKLMTRYLERRKDARSGYTGVLWILLNSSEFVLNH